MPNYALMKTVLREIVGSPAVPRTPEPDLVMDDPDKVAAYVRAGREDGVMAPVYLYHCAQICDVLKPGDTALDLGCGPATQLGMVARLNPEVQFTGVDLSPEMLDRARAYVQEQDINNVDFLVSDITALNSVENESIDAVFSTVALHHVPDRAALEAVFSEIARVLKPGGGLYLVDFGRLKSEKSIQYFANQYAAQQSELFTLDYLYSLRAAFTRSEFQSLAKQYLGKFFAVRSTFGMPFMVTVKSARRAQSFPAELTMQIEELRARMPDHHKADLKDLLRFFRLGGLRCDLLEG